MQVFLIDAFEKTVSAVHLEDGLQGVRRLIGFDSVDSDEVDDNGDRLYFDESCFIREQSHPGRFKVDSLAPVAGRGVIAGGGQNSATLAEPVVTLDALKARVQFL